MTAPAAIKATFSDFQLVKTRKLAKLIFEIPVEQADEALKVLGGLPRSDSERWVGIALLDMQAGKAPKPAIFGRTFDNGEGATRRAFCDLPFPQQAGIKSDDLKFQLWMSLHYHSGNGCADAIRNYCGVSSRAHILPGTEAGDRWIELLRNFENYR